MAALKGLSEGQSEVIPGNSRPRFDSKIDLLPE
jgi:hypothetical protein